MMDKLAEIARKHAQDDDGYGTEALAAQARPLGDLLAPFLSLMKTPHDTISKTALQAVLDTIGPRLAAQERELEEEKNIVDRVWKALGVESYEQAGGKSIDELVTALRSQLSQAEADLEHAERNEEEQALTIQILNGKLSQARAAAEFGGYLANAAAHFQSEYENECFNSDAWRALNSAIYEFNKRRVLPEPQRVTVTPVSDQAQEQGGGG